MCVTFLIRPKSFKWFTIFLQYWTVFAFLLEACSLFCIIQLTKRANRYNEMGCLKFIIGLNLVSTLVIIYMTFVQGKALKTRQGPPCDMWHWEVSAAAIGAAMGSVALAVAAGIGPWTSSNLRRSIASYSTHPTLMDRVQEELRCCGDTSYKDWLTVADWTGGRNPSGRLVAEGVPSSCCSKKLGIPCNNKHPFLDSPLQSISTLWSNGCSKEITNSYRPDLITLSILMFVISLLQICLSIGGRIFFTGYYHFVELDGELYHFAWIFGSEKKYYRYKNCEYPVHKIRSREDYELCKTQSCDSHEFAQYNLTVSPDAMPGNSLNNDMIDNIIEEMELPNVDLPKKVEPVTIKSNHINQVNNEMFINPFLNQDDDKKLNFDFSKPSDNPFLLKGNNTVGNHRSKNKIDKCDFKNTVTKENNGISRTEYLSSSDLYVSPTGCVNLTSQPTGTKRKSFLEVGKDIVSKLSNKIEKCDNTPTNGTPKLLKVLYNYKDNSKIQQGKDSPKVMPGDSSTVGNSSTVTMCQLDASTDGSSDSEDMTLLNKRKRRKEKNTAIHEFLKDCTRLQHGLSKKIKYYKDSHRHQKVHCSDSSSEKDSLTPKDRSAETLGSDNSAKSLFVKESLFNKKNVTFSEPKLMKNEKPPDNARKSYSKTFLDDDNTEIINLIPTRRNCLKFLNSESAMDYQRKTIKM